MGKSYSDDALHRTRPVGCCDNTTLFVHGPSCLVAMISKFLYGPRETLQPFEIAPLRLFTSGATYVAHMRMTSLDVGHRIDGN
jgi:hypothetical protein